MPHPFSLAYKAAQGNARKIGYVETILGRRRHLPDMQLPEFEFSPMKGYVNPDVDPMDPSTLVNKDSIPDRVVKQLQQEFKSYKYFGQIAKRTRELYEEDHIRVTNNRPKITDASRQCVNSIIQGSAADMTKMAILQLESSGEWKALGGRLLVPLDKWKEGGELLSKTMSDAGSFLPFPINCDVTTTLRWYGLEYPCAYEKPARMDELSEEGIKWLQYQLCELEYILPTFKDENGEKYYDVIIVNFANPDMVGHTGVFEAAVKAVETVDSCVGRAVDALLAAGGQMFLCADHGNCEVMWDEAANAPMTAHTTNPVPFLLIGAEKGVTLKEGGRLCDIAPTLLDLMGLAQPAEMTGHSLLVRP